MAGGRGTTYPWRFRMPRKRDNYRKPKPAVKGKGLAIRAKRFQQDITAIAHFIERVSEAKRGAIVPL
jgi:hypothetical protein